MQNLDRAISFIVECEKLKGVLRRSYLVGIERRENSAEHSWSLAVMAMALMPGTGLDALRVLKMLLIHDIVEIDAGDTFAYAAQDGKVERERLAAERIFGLLDPEVAREFHALWEEFEAGTTPEAAFSNGLDRLMPILQNFRSEGRSWRENGVRYEQVVSRNQPALSAAADGELWAYAKGMIEEARDQGWLPVGGDPHTV